MKRLFVCVGVALACAPSDSLAQAVFHSHQAANLPTAETLPSGAWLFEISHRFDRAISDGTDAFWGLDGPVLNRLGLTYAPSGSVMLGVLRSNFQDNVELNAKVGLYEGGGALPTEVAAMAGVAWNTEPTEIEGATDNESQFYAQLILNAMLGGRLAVGVVPTYLRNPRIRDFEAANAFILGLNGQLYMSDAVSFLAEWIVSEGRAGLENDAGTFGVELETRGHHFKLLITNQARMNPTQYLAGTRSNFEPDEWRFGFNITRLLPF
ncbi:MAG: DUF5777 family beta-barrel protein [Gemmatimonadota bacterium]|nr:DUF5777 family beta-barrel protein [Gemmatimonadota bacterium]MDH3423959.1 DUF5777 family beta-barrel protein [Gemmatimonadota bacterium]